MRKQCQAMEEGSLKRMTGAGDDLVDEEAYVIYTRSWINKINWNAKLRNSIFCVDFITKTLLFCHVFGRPRDRP